MNGICGLGYVGLEVSDVAANTALVTDVLGLELAQRTGDGTAHFRLDDYASRIALHPGPANDLAYAGWELGAAEDLRSLTDRLRAAGVDVTTEPAGLARSRNVCELISFRDPDGLRHEAFYGPLLVPESPFKSPRPISGFVTGSQGCGHIVLAVADPEAEVRFFVDVLGFRISDFIDVETPAGAFHLTFLHCSSRHHSIALAQRRGNESRLHHVMLEVNELDDVGSTYYLAQQSGYVISSTLGRHTNDNMLSFYVTTPAGFSIEYGWGGLEVDDGTWHVRRYRETSTWGHVRTRHSPQNVAAGTAPREAVAH